MRLLLFVVLSFILSGSAGAQQKIGNWKVDHFKQFGEWESFCDHRMDGAKTLRRCYVRRAEVYSARPKFGALYFFLTREGAGTGKSFAKLEFGFEPGSRFHSEGFIIEKKGKAIYRLNTNLCDDGHRCFVQGIPATTLQSFMVSPNNFRFRFTDKSGDRWDLSWEMEGFPEAVVDFTKASMARSLAH